DQLPQLLHDLTRTPHRRTRRSEAKGPDAGALRQRLAELAAAEREQALLEIVVRHAAVILGHSGPEDIDPERDFLEAGFDSLSAMELRKELAAALGVSLPPLVVFDNKNPLGLAAYLTDELATAAPVNGDAAPARQSTPGAETLSDFFRMAVTSNEVQKGLTLLRSVADIRPRFTSAAEVDRVPEPVRLASGTRTPRLICFSTPMATGGVHQHARLVANFQGSHHISGLPTPGFALGESLPATAEAAVEVMARSVLLAAEDEPFVLLGYSSGGTLGYSTARHLEQVHGVRPAGVVLLDTYQVSEAGGGAMSQVFNGLAYGLLERESMFGQFDSARLTAMARYADLQHTFDLGPVTAPVLFVRAEEPFEGSGGNPQDPDGWQATAWDPAHTVRTAPGTHFTIVEDRADTTTGIVKEWLAELE
ncbi:thioesterase domain-containing protein, partial [Streptomyces sp. E11-3]|uniref:thioesterase domain-containing protein n=1 Tax=Streptomyces sp. E11-3 TaxID=3110112 RepID=UPI0039808AE7